MCARPILGELPGDAAAARAAHERPVERVALGAGNIAFVAAEVLEPVGDDIEIGVLVERVEGKPEAEAFGKRNLFLDGFARMDFFADAARFQVFLEIFRHQVAAVRGGVNEHVLRRRGERTVERDLERLVGGIAGVEREVVAKDDEALGTLFDEFDDQRQIDEVALVDLDDAQSFFRIFISIL